MKSMQTSTPPSVVFTPDYNTNEITEYGPSVIKKIAKILARGNNAEVKRTSDGKWVVYEVKKSKM